MSVSERVGGENKGTVGTCHTFTGPDPFPDPSVGHRSVWTAATYQSNWDSPTVIMMVAVTPTGSNTTMPRMPASTAMLQRRPV